VLLNLLLNAADAAGGGAAPAAEARVLVRVSRDGATNGARIEVEDNGPGVAAEIRGALFEPFATTKDVGKGTGLGLAICRGLVEAAGGTIAVEDAAGGGARFVLHLPAATVTSGFTSPGGTREGV
jgi:signal transduction histidine kinase